MVLYLSGLAILSVLVLVVLFTKFVKLAHSGEKVSHMKIWITTSWAFLLLLIGSTGGAIFVVARSHVAVPVQQKTTSRKVANKTQVQEPKLSFSPSNPIIYMQSVPVKFKLSANTNLKIVAHYSKLTYKEFKATKDSQTVTYDFNEPSEFDLVATRGSKKMVKHIMITKLTESSSSSSVTNKMSSSDTKATTN